MRENTKNYPGMIYEANDINFKDLPKIDCHLHTSWTDGEPTVKQIYENAVNKNLTNILYSEHCRKTSLDWFPVFAEEIRNLPTSPCRAYVGAEVKVQSWEGEIDSCSEIINLCDFIMVSVHRFIKEDGTTMQFIETNPKKATEIELKLSCAALSNPNVDILGHMFGMSYKRFNQLPSDEQIEKLIITAVNFNVAVEINSHYHPDPYKIINFCKKHDAKITFGSNAHSLSDVGKIIKF